jgi:hypothetical protein
MRNPTRPFRWARNWAVVLVVLLVAVLAAVGARQVTEQVRGAHPAQPAATAREARSDAAGEVGSGTLPAPAGETPVGQLRTEPGETSPVEITVGPVVAGEDFGFTPVPDRVSVAPGAAAARAARPGVSDAQGPVDGSSAGEPSGPSEQNGPGTLFGDADGSADLPRDAAPDEFTMVALVDPVGHHAEVRVGLGGGLDGGLAALTIDFGDRTDPFELDDDRIAALGNRGQVSVTHTYQPTLTPQPQTATVVVTDGAGGTHERILRFDTRAAYRLSYSPLTVTAVDDCDPFGKGDFELTWQNDRSLPLGKTSTFDLGQNESYLERGFPTTVAPVYHAEVPQLFLVDGKPAFLYLKVREKDNLAGAFMEFLLAFPYGFEGPAGVPDFLREGPVAQLGNHQYGVTLHGDAGTECDVRMNFTVALTML